MPSIKEKLKKSKYLVQPLQNAWFFVGVSVFLVIAILFGSFRLAGLLKAQSAFGVRVAEAAFPTNLSGKEGSYVAAKTGKTYYFPWCGMVNRIKETNLIWFSTRVAAEALGHKASSNCNGLK